jgi:hypothetical protein
MDLLLHALVGYALTAGSGIGVGPVKVAPTYALAAGVAAGVGKELADGRRFDAKDLAATILGSTAATVQLTWRF